MLLVLGCVLSLAFLCILIPVLEGWLAILLLRLQFKSEDMAWFIVLNILAIVLLPVIIALGRQILVSKRQLELTRDKSEIQQEGVNN